MSRLATAQASCHRPVATGLLPQVWLLSRLATPQAACHRPVPSGCVISRADTVMLYKHIKLGLSNRMPHAESTLCSTSSWTAVVYLPAPF